MNRWFDGLGKTQIMESEYLVFGRLLHTRFVFVFAISCQDGLLFVGMQTGLLGYFVTDGGLCDLGLLSVCANLVLSWVSDCRVLALYVLTQCS